MHLVILILVVLPRLTSVFLMLVLAEEKMDQLVLKFGLMVLVELNLDGLLMLKSGLVVKVPNHLLRDLQVVVFYSTLLKQMRIELMLMLVLENFILLMVLQNLLVHHHQKLQHTSRFLVVLNRTLYLTGMVQVLYHLLGMQLKEEQIITGLQVHYGLGQVEKRKEHTIIIHYLMLSSTTKIMDQLLHK